MCVSELLFFTRIISIDIGEAVSCPFASQQLPLDEQPSAPPGDASLFDHESEVAVSFLRDTINAVIVIDRRGIIRDGNPAVTRSFGYRAEDLPRFRFALDVTDARVD